MPRAAVTVVTRIGVLRDTDSSFPVNILRPVINRDVGDFSPKFFCAVFFRSVSITRWLPPRRIIAWLLTTKMISLSFAVCTVSPGIIRVSSVDSLPLAVACQLLQPIRRAIGYCTHRLLNDVHLLAHA